MDKARKNDQDRFVRFEKLGVLNNGMPKLFKRLLEALEEEHQRLEKENQPAKE